jgi:hypothetical protein
MVAAELYGHQASGCGKVYPAVDAPWMIAIRQQLEGAVAPDVTQAPLRPAASQDFECAHCPHVFTSFEGLQSHVEEEHTRRPTGVPLDESAMELATPSREDECEYVYR